MGSYFLNQNPKFSRVGFLGKVDQIRTKIFLYNSIKDLKGG